MNPTPAPIPSLPLPKDKVTGVDLCVACGRYHGSVGFELWCLRRALQAARAALRARGPSEPPK
jgi:hypothetical protein